MIYSNLKGKAKMSPRLPRITAAQLVRALKRAGWVEVRQKGSHMSLEYADKQVVVPMHASTILKPGTLKSILRQADLTVDDLLNLLKG
jgi:predicted RNA binding protein YcfA (HicA-like mRNA interferase family)